MPTAAIRVTHKPEYVSLGHGRLLELRERPIVMGILNITPDSFSDGGLWLEPRRAVERAETMVAAGAEILDLGAESTRPGGGVYGAGAVEVSAAEELSRLLPVLEAVRDRISVPISVDTRKADVAGKALTAGADFVNDIGALSDPEMPAVIAETDCSVILMHSRGRLGSMQRNIEFRNVVHEVVVELRELVDQAVELGIKRSRIVVDPGIGFGKRTSQNLEILGRLGALRELELPILIGSSRKSFIGDLVGKSPRNRLPGSLATVSWAARHGASIVRVHDVAETVQFLTIWKAIRAAEKIDS